MNDVERYRDGDQRDLKRVGTKKGREYISGEEYLEVCGGL